MDLSFKDDVTVIGVSLMLTAIETLPGMTESVFFNYAKIFFSTVCGLHYLIYCIELFFCQIRTFTCSLLFWHVAIGTLFLSTSKCHVKPLLPDLTTDVSDMKVSRTVFPVE